jgi:hypothetical protein
MPIPIFCAICGNPCNLEDCKVTYDGKPVHDDCVVAKLTEKKVDEA